MSDSVDVRLSGEEALVLFEFLSRFCNEKEFTIEHPAESRVFCDVLCILESKLTAPFDPEYARLLASARESLTRGSAR